MKKTSLLFLSIQVNEQTNKHYRFCDLFQIKHVYVYVFFLFLYIFVPYTKVQDFGISFSNQNLERTEFTIFLLQDFLFIVVMAILIVLK